MIWNETKECMSRDEKIVLQSARLVKTVDRVYHNVPFYRKKMQSIGIEPGDVRGVEDLHILPFTTKADLRDNYPFGLFAVPQSEIVRIHASSGTTGKATVVGYTRKDLEIWSECVARALIMAGVTRDDIIQVAYGYGLFTGGARGSRRGGETGSHRSTYVNRQYEETDDDDGGFRSDGDCLYAFLSASYCGNGGRKRGNRQDTVKDGSLRRGAVDGKYAPPDGREASYTCS